MHQKHFLCIWLTLCLGAMGESSLSIYSHPHLPFQVSAFQKVGWSSLVNLRPLLWDVFSALSYKSAHARMTHLTVQTEPLCDAALPLAIFNQCLQSLDVLSVGLLLQSLDLKVMTFPGMKSGWCCCFWKAKSFLLLDGQRHLGRQ